MTATTANSYTTAPRHSNPATKPAKRGSHAKRRVWLLPREHGAYAQLLLPLIAALAVGGATAAGFAFAGAFVAVFVGQEALRTLLGHRGRRKQRELRRLATAWLTGSGAVAAGLVALAVVLAPQVALLALLVPALLGAVAVGFVLLRREKTALGEIIAALALSACAVPVVLAGSVSVAAAAILFATFAVVFAFATVAVRLMIRHFKRPVALAWRALFAVAAVMVVAAGFAVATWQPFAAASAVAAAPVLALSAGLALKPPHPRKLRETGWVLAATTTLATFLLIAGYANVA